MAFRTKKISQMDPKGSNLASTDLLEISELVSGSYVTKSITGAEIIASVPASVTAWGTITGTLSAQTDLNTALNGKVPTTRTLTINGTTQDLSADRTFTISTGITIGTTAITSGTVGRVLFEGTGNVVQESANLFWDNTNGRLGVGTSTPNVPLEVNGSANIQTLTIGLGNSAVSTNTALGNLTLRDNTTGFSNTASGYQALRNNTTGSSNTAFGVQALVNNLIGTNNVSVGQSSLLTNTSGSNITAIGWNAGGSNTTGSNNIFIGFNSTGVSNTESNRTWIGNSSTATTWLAGNVLINTTTDAGFKLDVNGTARVSDATTIGSASFSSSSNLMTLISNAGTCNVRITGGGQFRVSSSLFASVLQANDYIEGVRILLNGQVRLTATSADWLRVTNWAQNANGNVSAELGTFGTAYATINASAQVEIASTTKGFLPPRMTTTQKNAIASPATGLMVYDTTLNLIALYNGTIWTTL